MLQPNRAHRPLGRVRKEGELAADIFVSKVHLLSFLVQMIELMRSMGGKTEYEHRHIYNIFNVLTVPLGFPPSGLVSSTWTAC